MVDNILSKSGGLLKTSAWGAVAAALAMMALPSAAFAQDRGDGRGRGGQSAQAQSPGGNPGGRSWGGNRGGGDGGQRAVRSGGPDRGNWNRAQATPNRQVAPRQTARPDVNQGQQRNWNRGDTSNGAAWRASQGQRLRQQQEQRDQTRTVERQRQNVERQRQAAEWQRQNQARDAQWSNRNRTYSDPNRNRNYRDERGNIRRDNDRRNDNRWTGNNRWNDGNRWNDNRRRNDSYRWSNSGRWDRDWRRDNRYDWHGYRNNNRSAFRMGRYYAPYQNYYYRPVGIGFRLDTLFFGNRYWLDDPGYYRLPPAYGPYRWIRYYDDALLVDIHSGEVIDVINNFFW